MNVNDVLKILLEDSKKRDVILESILYVQINDTISIKNSCSIFKNVYAMNTVPFIMKDLQLMTRQNKNLHPLYSTGLLQLRNVDAVVFNSKDDMQWFDAFNSRYIAVMSEIDSITGFRIVEKGVFAKDDDVISSTEEWGDEATILSLKNIKPTEHCYGRYSNIEEGKVDIIGSSDEKINEAKKENPYSNTWLFKKKEDSSNIDNIFILKEDISREDMLKIIGILSKAEYRKFTE